MSQRHLTDRFLDLLNLALQESCAHLAGPSPGPGFRIGWKAGDTLYLDPVAAYRTAQQEAARQGQQFDPGPYTLRRALRAAGLLLSTEPYERRLTIRVVIQGKRRRVPALPASTLNSQQVAHQAA
jgi:hypothetical protein